MTQFCTTVRGNMRRNSMLKENMEYEQLGKQWGIDCIDCRDKNGFLRKPINDNKDGIITRGGQEFLDEVHRNGIPQMFQNWELQGVYRGDVSDASSAYK